MGLMNSKMNLIIDHQNYKINGNHSWLLEYYHKARAGNKALKENDPQLIKKIMNEEVFVVGNELMLSMDNLIEDLERFDYDIKDSEKRIAFIERFCKHTKSPFYGKHFKLTLWEKAFIEAFYSFKDFSTGFRRFKRAILLIARKNGKSTLCAALALTELMVGSGGIDIVCSSNDYNQADIIFEEINNMRERFDPKDKRTHKNLRGIYNTRKKSTVKKMSEKTKNKEGRNIDYAFIDEIHEMIKNTISKPIEQSTSTKDECGIFEITTEGFIVDGYLDDQTAYARRLLAREIEDDSLLVWFYTQDSEQEIWQDRRTHFKSNPSLHTIKKERYLDEQIKKAMISSSDRIYTMAKDFNIKQTNVAAWLRAEDIESNLTYDINELRGCFGIGGVDLAETTDLASAKLMIMRPGSREKIILQQYFIPESKLEVGEKEDRDKYKDWAKAGLLTISPGNENDFSLITKWFVKLHKEYGIKAYKIGYDNALAKYWVEEMEGIGFDMERIAQNFTHMSEPAKLVEEDMKSHLINYNKNPIDKWCYENAAVKVDSLARIMVVKPQNKIGKKIDGTIAHIIATAVYIRNRSEYITLINK